MSGNSPGFALFLAVCGVMGCASHTAPKGYLPTTAEAQQEVFGGWIEVTYRTTGRANRVEGELIAVAQDSIWVKDASGGVVIPTQAIVRGQLVAFNPRVGRVRGGALLGFLSTALNGYFLIFTAPMWVIGGTAASAFQSKLPVHELPLTAWTDLAAFARFPQGIPPGVSLQSLRPKGR